MGLLNHIPLLRNLFPPPQQISHGGTPNVTGLSLATSWKFYEEQMKAASDRIARYNEYERMDTDDLTQSVLDAYVENSTQPDLSTNRSIWPVADNSSVRKLIDALFERVQLEDVLYGITYGMCKMGDDFNLVETSEANGIESLQPLKAQEVERVQDQKTGTLQGFKIKDKTENTTPWDVLQFALIGKNRRSGGGDSILQSAVSAWKRVRMCEDQAVVYRLKSIPGRDVWQYEIGDSSEREANMIGQRLRSRLRTNKLYDPATGAMRTELNPQSIEDMLLIPIRNGKELYRYQRLPGEAASMDVSDLMYFLKRFFGCVRVPMAYFGFDESHGLFEYDKSLLQKDLRFARGCKKIQRSLIKGLTRLIQIQMCYMGLDPKNDENAFVLGMVPVSYLDEQQRSELLDLRLDVVTKLKGFGDELNIDKVAWFTFLMNDIVGLTPDFLSRLLRGDEDVEGQEPLNAQQQEALRRVLADSRIRNRLLRTVGLVPSSDMLSSKEGLPAVKKP